MTHDYRQRINAAYDNLSPSYKRVADYVMPNYMEVAFMTAAEVADAANVDTTSVVRFAQRLAYPGYPEFLAEVRAHVREEVFGQLGHGKAAYEDALVAWLDYENARILWATEPPSASLAERTALASQKAHQLTNFLISKSAK